MASIYIHREGWKCNRPFLWCWRTWKTVCRPPETLFMHWQRWDTLRFGLAGHLMCPRWGLGHKMACRIGFFVLIISRTLYVRHDNMVFWSFLYILTLILKWCICRDCGFFPCTPMGFFIHSRRLWFKFGVCTVCCAPCLNHRLSYKYIFFGGEIFEACVLLKVHVFGIQSVMWNIIGFLKCLSNYVYVFTLWYLDNYVSYDSKF